MDKWALGEAEVYKYWVLIVRVLFADNCAVPAGAGFWEAPKPDAVGVVSHLTL
jgi:hypothetical protein